MSPNKTLYIRDEDMPLWERAERLAKSTRQSVSLIVAAAMKRYLGVADDIEVHINTPDPTAVTVEERPALVYGTDPAHGEGWTLYFKEPDGSGIDQHFIPGRVDEVEWALSRARHWLQQRQQAEGMQEITVEVGDPPVKVGFVGRWVIEPDPAQANQGGMYYGVALTKRGRIAVYAAHAAGVLRAALNDFDSLGEAEKSGVLPRDVANLAAGSFATEERVVWRDI